MATKDELRHTVRELRANFDRNAESVRANENLSPAGKRAAIARSWVGHRNQLQKLRDRTQGERADRRGRLERELFGSTSFNSSEAISFRDAFDRAEQLEEEKDATRLLDQAARTGDQTLRKAVLMRAFDRDWGEVLDYAGRGYDGQDDKLRELTDLIGQMDGKYGRMADEVLFGMPKTPEVRSMTSAELEAIEQALTQPELEPEESPEPPGYPSATAKAAFV